MSFPIIDISNISEPSTHDVIAEQITRACKEWGVLLIRGHQIPRSAIDEMFAISREFFHLSEEQKTKFPITADHVGYIGSFQDRTKDDKMSMWFSGAPGYLETNKHAVPPFWHPHISKLESFKHKCHDLVVQILECFGLALGLPDIKFFASAHQEDVADGDRIRFLLYPAREEKPSIISEEVTRMIPHTDSNSVTIVFQTSPGLEVMSPDGKEWLKVPYHENCALINLGDTLAYWSGAQLKATLHRITFDGVPQDVERQSIAYFGSANPETVLRPLVSEHRKIEDFRFNGERVEDGITVGELQTMIMHNTYGDYRARAARPVA